jgi:hypothetical protein
MRLRLKFRICLYSGYNYSEQVIYSDMQLNTSGISEYIAELKETAEISTEKAFWRRFGTWI